MLKVLGSSLFKTAVKGPAPIVTERTVVPIATSEIGSALNVTENVAGVTVILVFVVPACPPAEKVKLAVMMCVPLPMAVGV